MQWHDMRPEKPTLCPFYYALLPFGKTSHLSFAKLQVYPSGGKPVTRWSNEDDAFEDIVKGIAAAVAELLSQRRQHQQDFETSLAKSPLPLSPEAQPELETWQKRTKLSDSEISEKISAIVTQRQIQAQLVEQQQREQAEREWQEQERLRTERLQQAQAAAERRAAEERLRTEQIRQAQAAAERRAEEQEQERIREARAKHQSFTIWIGDRRLPLALVPIPGGKFWMGSPKGEGNDDEKPRHEVAIAPFYMSKYPITQAQYQAVMDQNPSSFEGAHRPVEQVSWRDAIAFCEALSRLGVHEVSLKEIRQFTLPSEAQWEYACRAGTETPFYWGETISTDQANYDGNYVYGSGQKGSYREQTTEVGTFPPNNFGLYDMHGNVWEWCADHWHGNYHNAPTDGSAWTTNNKDAPRLLRGGS